MKSFLGMIFASALLVACGSSGGGTPDARKAIDAHPTIDAPVGPTIDAPTGGPDADTSMAAKMLGTACNMATPCQTGYKCVLLMGASATNGYCANSCCVGAPMTCVGTEDTCGAASGFAGPGVGYCGLSDSTGTMHSCAIGCGEQNGGNTMCPSTLTCQDLINMNGMGDLCAAPLP